MAGRGDQSPVFIIAEAGVNHNGDCDLAIELIDQAVEAGADAVKFQTFNAHGLVSVQAPKAAYQMVDGGPEESQVEMLKKLALSPEDHLRLTAHCRQRQIRFLSTPFDLNSLDFLVQQLGLGLIKLSSGALTHGPLLLATARSGARIILSTGLSALAEVEQALMILAHGLIRSQTDPGLEHFEAAYNSLEGQQALREKVTLLHCTTQYPAPLIDVNLRAMDTLSAAFGLTVGFSDHTAGISVPLAAVARGARVIEKHFTLDQSLPGPDHKASLEPDLLSAMIWGIREVEQSLGDGIKRLTPSELENRSVVRTSLTALSDISAGECFTEENLGVKRPGFGLSPIHYWSWLGRLARRNFAKDEAID
ncbi:MAG: N-acetylneuraminate synthase [Magnetococcales bacterium]|nr:N-acetylneuraminate synthase [Magnetococcales bacterium]